MPTSGPSAALAAAGRARFEGQFDVCLKKVEEAWPKAKNLHAWLVTAELECLAKDKNPNSARIEKAIGKVEKNLGWMLTGPHASNLRASYIAARLAQIEADTKNNRTRARAALDATLPYLSYADQKTQAKFWRLGGELMFLSQRGEEARELFKRSLAELESEEVRAKLGVVEKSLAGGKDGVKPSVEEANGAKPEAKSEQKSEPKSEAKTEEKLAAVTLDASPEELELVDRVTLALKSGDLVTAVADGVKLIRGFPGSSRAKWAADRALDAYNAVADKSDPKIIASRAQMIKEMEKADSDRLGEWARAMYSRGQWDDALQLTRKNLETLSGPRSTAVLDFAAKCAMATDRFDVALEYFQRLVRAHGGTPTAREALLRSGLVRFRLGQYAQAAADFERLLAMPQVGLLEVSARYWLWRSLQRLKSDRADATADELMRKYAFSYYGLRARIERNAGTLEWKQEPAPLKTKLWLTAYEQKAFERAKALAQAGWLEEAQMELKELPLPQKAEDKAMRSLIWAAAGHYTNASRLANEAWDEKAEFRRPPFITASFPVEFANPINQNAALRKLDRDLVRSLIKQESGFNLRAVSPSNALGLMQLMAPTAREAAQDLRSGPLDIPDDLFKGPRNIQLGTHYLSRLVSRYQGHIPLALASYNAGPTRIDRWLKGRPSLRGLAVSRSSKPEDEIWIDEIPYMETSIYVKSILRNLLMYKVLDQSRVQVPDPIWAIGKFEKQ